MRHNEALIDQAAQKRSLNQERRHGRWATERSTLRYEKCGRINEMLAETRMYCLGCEEQIELTIHFGDALPWHQNSATSLN